MTSKRGGGLLRINKTQAKKSKGKIPNLSGGLNANQSGGFPTSSVAARAPIPQSPKRDSVSSEELEKRTARANRFRDTLDPSQLLSVGRVVPHGRNLTIRNEGPPINPVDDFFEVLSIYHQTQMKINQINDTLPSVRKKLAWDFFHERTTPITLNSLYENDESDKSKNLDKTESENVTLKVNELTNKPKALDLPTASNASNFFDVEMEDVEQFIATSPVTPGSTFRYEMDVDETFPSSYIPPFTQMPSLSNTLTINPTDQLIFGPNMLSQFQRTNTRSTDVMRKSSLERANSIIPAPEKSSSMLSIMDVEYDNYSNQGESFLEPDNNTLVGSPTDEEFNKIEETATDTVDEPDVTSDTEPPIEDDEQDDELGSPDLPTPKLDLYSLVHGPPPLTQAQLFKEEKIKQRQALYKKTKVLPDRILSETKRRKKGYDTLINKNRNVQCVLAHIDDQKAKATKKAQEVEIRRKAIEAQSSHDEDYESVKKEIRRRNQIFERITNKYNERAKKDPKYKYSMTKIEEEALIEIDNTPSLLRS
ncbi:36192_t:CDS:2 [Gigaspora margarita]|uniref:36192_t:CDS:1 n=1 Tax=Gigaspora margarita TaxID=4874 RepID=A0ABN7V3A6_GIGMA|nr:36192_t:CDS:2 [Gigaspora margarita]